MPALLDQQHVPREPVALPGPAVVAGVGEVPERQGQLDDDPRHRQRQRAPATAAPARDPGHRHAAARARASSRRGQSGSKNTVAAPIISQGNTPIGNSAQVQTWNATSTHQAGQPGAPPQQQRARRGSRRRRRRPRTRAGRRSSPRAGPSTGHAGPGRAARAERQGLHQPVGLAAWPARRRRRPRPPGTAAATPTRRPPCVGPPARRASRLSAPPERRHHRQRADQGEEPVVVEVGRGVDQLDPRERDDETAAALGGCASPAPSATDASAEQRPASAHICERRRLGDPAEAEVGEAVTGPGVERSTQP